MVPIVTKVTFVANCRECLKDFTLESNPDIPSDGLDVEMLAHETLEANGWADSMCPGCWDKVPPVDRDYDNATEKILTED